MSRTNHLIKAGGVAVLLTLGACSTGLSTQVSRFNNLTAPNGQSFVIQAANPRNQGGIEFNQYAQLVRQHLIGQGFAEAPAGGHADLVVYLDYGIDNGQAHVTSYPSFYGYHGFYGYRPYYWGWYDPFLFDGYPEIESYTVYTSFVDMDIKRTVDGRAVFEGMVKARSTGNQLTSLVPDLVEAMFTNFPGHSGETVKITIPSKQRSAGGY
jgi:uncharacterized protein DUF4136